MKRLRYAVHGIALTTLGLIGLACESAPPGQFTADVTVGDVGKVTKGKIYVKNDKYRLELDEGGRESILIVDQQANLSRILSPEYKTYIQMRANDRQSVMVDQIQGLMLLKGMYGATTEGEQEVAGYECQRNVIQMQGQPILTEYYSEQLHFPLKIDNQISEEVFFELSNIKREALDDSLFAIPAGYHPKTEPGKGPVQIPPWVSQVQEVNPTAPPFELKAAAGEMFRVPVEAGFGLDVRGRNVGEGSAAYVAVPFINGLPIKDAAIYTLNLPKKGTTGGWTFEETPLEADQIVVRVNEGTVDFTVQQVELGYGQTVAAGKSLAVPVEPDKEIIMRLVNVGDDESTCAVTLLRNGVKIQGDTVGPVSFRTVNLKTRHASERRTYAAAADQIVVEVEKGKMLVNIRQP